MVRSATVWLIAVLAATSCEGSDESNPSSLILGDRMVYTLDWDRTGTTPLTDGSGWRSVNDLGFEFEIKQGFLVTNRMELLPCNWGVLDDAGPTDLAEAFWNWLVGRRAIAGHPEDAPNSTRVLNFAEPVHSAMTVAYSTHETEPSAYCRFSYAVARADVATTDRPETPAITGQSLRLVGRWRAPGDRAWQRFDWMTSIPWGAFWDFSYARPVTDDGESIIRVSVTRPLAQIFAGLDPLSQRQEVLGNKAVQNMVTHLRVELRQGSELWHTQQPN